MALYPLLMNLEDKFIVVIGGGEVAFRKVQDLCQAGAVVLVISPWIHPELEKLAADPGSRVTLKKRKYKKGDLKGAMLVFSATNQPDVNRQVFREAEKRNIFINAVDDPPNCTFIVPSVERRGDLILALSTSGSSPAMAARLRREIASHIPQKIEVILPALREARDLLKTHKDFSSLESGQRGELLKEVVADDRALEELAAAYEEKRLVEYLRGKAVLS